MPDPSSVMFKPRFVEKPWGRAEIPPIFGSTGGRKVGELWYEQAGDDDLPLLVKYIFTSEKLSVQVHPDEAQARTKGLPRGKNECWYILDADEGASLGLGLKAELSHDDIRAAALDGSIERLMDWKPVSAGDFVYVPAGTIHAIGAGIVLLEVQQNSDVTYRLYDYGRPRELHLDEGVAVSRASYDADLHFRPSGGPVNVVLLHGPDFTLVRADSNDAIPDSISGRRRWVIPVQGSASTNGVSVEAGSCLLAGPGQPLTIAPSSVILVGAEGAL